MLAARSLAQAEPVPAGAHPWWDDFPFIIQCSSVDEAARYRPTASMCGDADDAAWGIYGQRVRVAEARGRALRFQAAGIRPLAWGEGFGNPSCYVIQIKQNPDGSWIKVPGTDVTRVFCNAWGWKVFDGTGEAHWVGVHTYFDDVDYARPYTRTHPRYGTPPMCYPDGRVATGYDGPARDPRNSRVFDAGCGKDVLGHMWGDARGKPLITDVLRGSVAESADRAAMADPATIMPDPGFTPAEWAERTRQSGALLRVEADKDSACPLWIDYARAEVRLALDTTASRSTAGARRSRNCTSPGVRCRNGN
jgi:hypothetical protein